MSRFGQRNVNFPRKKICGGFLILVIVGSVMLGCLTAGDIHSSPPTVSVSLGINGKASGSSFLDPTAVLNGFHLYNVTRVDIPEGGTDLILSYPANWSVMELGLNFFNGTLQKKFFQNTTTVTTSVMTKTSTGYKGSISASKVQANSTIYQAQFNITGIRVGEPADWTTANDLSNSSYPTIDGNVGIAQRFFLSTHASNLTIQFKLMRIEGTVGNLTAELRSSTSDDKVGGLIKTASYAATAIGSWSKWVQLSIPSVDLNPGYYFIILHTDNWLGAGGGYRAETTLSKSPTSPPSGWVSSDRGVNWENLVNLTSTSSYYFNGFKLEVRATPPPTPSDLNLRINGFEVADNFIWNQTAWSSVPTGSFTVTSDCPIPKLNFTYSAWSYSYDTNNLLANLTHIIVNAYKDTTAIKENSNFAMMYVNLNRTDLDKPGVVDPSTSTIKINLKLFSNITAIPGTLNVTACAQLSRQLTLPPMDPSSLMYSFNYTQSGGLYNNVTLASTAITVGPINSQIEDVYINTSAPGAGARSRGLWSYNSEARWLFIYREAFSVIPQFTLVDGLLFNCTVITFNNFTASVSTIVTGSEPDTTPIASVQVVNSTPLIDLDGVREANITVTAPDGTVINNSRLTLTGGLYKFNWTLESGAGIYGLEITSVCNRSDYVATRWIGAATVDDFVLSPPEVILAEMNGQALTGNLTSGQRTLIMANVSYVDHNEFTFSGTMNVTIYLGSTGEVDHVQATWNSTTKTYSATYDAPTVDSATFLTIYVEAVDLKGRISANSTSTYLVPQPGPDIPQLEPSLTAILELLFVALALLIPLVAYVIEKHRKAKS